MKALLLKEYMKLEVTEVPEPELGPEDLLVRVRACGICGSDIHGIDGSTGRRIPPLVMGHEAAGVVAKVGSAVTAWKINDRITFDSMISCGKCPFCRSGHMNLCDNRMVLGVSCGDYRRHGAFAEYVAVPQHICYMLPDELPFEHAALIEAVSVAVHAVEVTPVRLGDTAVVVGAGMIGVLTVQAAKNAGCTTVYAVDLDDAKLEMAVKLGAAEGFNPKHCDPVAEILKRTNGKGADIVLEAVGATDPIKTAIACVRKAFKLMYREHKKLEEIRSIFIAESEGVMPIELLTLLNFVEWSGKGKNGRGREAFRPQPPQAVEVERRAA